MRKIILLVLTFIAFFFYKESFAQQTNHPKVYYGDGKNKPFDKEYDLMIPYAQQQSIDTIFLYRHKGNKGLLESFKKEKNGVLKTSIIKGSWEKLRDTNFLKLELRYNEDKKAPYSLLKPGGTYSIIAVMGIDLGSQSLIKALGSEYKKNNGSISDTGIAFKNYKKQRKIQNTTPPGIVTYSTNFDDYKSFYIDELRPLEDSLASYIVIEKGGKENCKDKEKELISSKCLGVLLKNFNGEGCIAVPVKCIDTCTMLNLILSLQNFKCKDSLDFIRGKFILTNILSEKLHLSDDKYAGRKTNVEINIADLTKLINLIRQIRLQLKGDECKESLECLIEIENLLLHLIKSLVHSGKQIDTVVKWQNEIKKVIVDSELFSDYSIANANTYIYNFQARNEMAITPVFGYAYYGFQSGFNGFTPYLGFQINFQGVNREDPFNQIHRKTVWQRMCLTTAWTLTAIEEKNKRYDLFNKSSLITAIGYKFSHIVMFNAGALWFRQEDADPLVTKKKMAVSPVLSISVNMEIDKLLNGFSKLIPIK